MVMNLQKRFNLFLLLFVLAILVPTIAILIISFREFSIESALDRANTIAKLVRDGLTTHMENGIMDKRALFLAKIKRIKGVENLKILRSPTVDRQFGKSVESLQSKDEIEKRVLQEGKELYDLKEGKRVHLKVVVPYIASQYESPNCLKCHQAREGEVLGAISMTFDISDIRKDSIIVIFKILFATLLITILGFYIFNRYIKRYTAFFEELASLLTKAFRGDYNVRMNIHDRSELGELSAHVNELFEKIRSSLETIQKNVNYFLKTSSKEQDPILQVQELVSELAAVYKFKNIIERDKNIEQIYDRIIELLKRKFGIEKFAIYEYDLNNSKRQTIYMGLEKPICHVEDDFAICRAYRTKSMVNSDRYLQVCGAVEDKKIFYVCLPFEITKDLTVVINFATYDESEYKMIKEKIASIQNFIAISKTAIETQRLLEELKELSLKDRLTGAYNRRYLDIFVKKNIPQALRANIPYSLLMLDIDHFKMVNDTYGHDAGDKVIKELVKTIFENIRESDVVVRFGGEEFLVLLYNCPKEEALKVAQKIKEAFKKKRIDVGSEKISKTVSIGVSEFPRDSKQFWQAIKFADIALYKAKENGRDRVEVYEGEAKEGGEY